MSLGVSKRRVQRLGGSSLIITLPKIWARKVGIGIGDEVVVVDEGNQLKILPPSSELVKNMGSLTVKLSSYLKELDPRELARCAFIAGYDRLIIELPRSNGVNPEEILEELRKSDYVLEAVQVMNVIEAQLLSAKDANRKFLKLIANILYNIADGLTNRKTTLEEAYREYEKARMITDIVARSVFRNKVVTCSGENVNPMTVGIMYTVLGNFETLLKELANSPDDAGETAREVATLLVLVASAVANTSGKRLLEVEEKVDELMEKYRGRNDRVAGIASALLSTIRELAKTALCFTTTQNQNKA
ncbi:MAG: AbrB/MazE/SpoVT family DNA-binding domain-containing protein [Desulfurococcales archaeon]|nr:AbrB/MazE/SpoVT family DNA-binding domain-containing protein [Desulfurococcales archaeon]